ncbi:MAG: aldo/keto reductase [bacterium]
MLSSRPCGFTTTSLTTLGFGAWAIGGNAFGATDDSVSIAALRTAYDCGARFIDTADVYGKGHSEALICQALGDKRDDLVIASKVGFNFYDGSFRGTFDGDYIRRCCDLSLQRLGTHVIDIYQLHNPPVEAIESGEAQSALLGLQQAGKIRLPAVSVSQVNQAPAALGVPLYQAMQIIYNVIDQRPRTWGVLDEARVKGVGVIARVPLAHGLLTGKYQPWHVWKTPELEFRAKKPGDEIGQYLHRVKRFQRLVKEGVADSIVELALRFCISDPGVTSVIPGLKSPDQVHSAVAAIEKGPLPADALAFINGEGLGMEPLDRALATI